MNDWNDCYNWTQLVEIFQLKYNKTIGEYPAIRDKELRLSLVLEEAMEFEDACDNNDIVEAVDALADMMYVIIGTAVAWGVDLDPIFREVHKTNMQKGGVGPTGKVMKPNGWKPPDILGLLKKQGYKGNAEVQEEAGSHRG